MEQLINLALDDRTIEEYGGEQGIRTLLSRTGCQGLEPVWGGQELRQSFSSDLAVGYHLTFYSDWLDFYLGNTVALKRKFVGAYHWTQLYQGENRAALMEHYRKDLKRAEELGVKYVVFHVSDVSIEEGYTYVWEHSDEQVIDACCEIINELLGEKEYSFELLVENLWWAGFTFTQPKLTERLLSQIRYPKKGIMLDTGHLMNTNTNISSQEEGCDYIKEKIEEHGELCKWIRGVHLHQSTSGAYVKKTVGRLPEQRATDYLQRFFDSYEHILTIDTHQPFTSPKVREILKLIEPEYLVHELSAATKQEKEAAIKLQRKALGFEK